MEKYSVNLTLESLPRCYVIDESHRVVMECSIRPGEPPNPRFVSAGLYKELPMVLDRAVEVLRRTCLAESTASKSATLGNIEVQVHVLHGRERHTAVIVDHARAA